MMKVFAAGHRIEDEVLERFYPETRMRQQEVTLPLTNKIVVVGHIDGFDIEDGCLVEVKSQNKEEWDRFDREGWNAGLFVKYKWQVSAYMLGMAGVTSPPVVKLLRALRNDKGEWTGDMDVSYVDRPFYTKEQIRARVLRIEAAAHTGVLVAECDNSFPCPYFYIHEEIDRELIDDDAIEQLAREYEEARRDESTAKGRREATRKALRVAIDGDKSRTASGIKITFYKASSAPRLDKELIEGFLSTHDRTLDQFMRKGAESERLRVTIPEED